MEKDEEVRDNQYRSMFLIQLLAIDYSSVRIIESSYKTVKWLPVPVDMQEVLACFRLFGQHIPRDIINFLDKAYRMTRSSTHHTGSIHGPFIVQTTGEMNFAQMQDYLNGLTPKRLKEFLAEAKLRFPQNSIFNATEAKDEDGHS